MKRSGRINHFTDYLFKHTPDKVHQYLNSLYRSKKCNHISQGSAEIMKIMTWAHNENWRPNHFKSEHGHRKPK